MKVGILGGTFDPIHRGHEALGIIAARELQLDQVWIMPAGNSYFKAVRGKVTSARHREAMVKKVVEENPLFAYSDLEIRRPGYTYTADTLLTLTRAYPDHRFVFIIGADSLHDIKDWFVPEVICRLAELAVAGRSELVDREQMQKDADYLKERFGARIHWLELPDMPVSSSRIRQEIREGKLPHPALSPGVNAYIEEHGLYGKPRTAEEILESLKKRLKPSRVRHTIGVAETARKLAECWGEDADRAYLAGILHDCGKAEGSALSHAPLGAVIAREEYGIQDEEILSAIRWHTTGKPAMTLLEKIIFTADYIEPSRDRAPRLNELRKLAFENLDKTIVCILEDTLSYLQECGADIDGMSMETYTYYRSAGDSPA